MSKLQIYEVENYISELKNIGLQFLPHGIIEKSHTGMGATHMEIISSRNSIIVEPVKVTAYSKVNEYNEKFVNDKSKYALYVGSEIGLQKSSTSTQQIKEYLENRSIEFKKIICVADSLPKVVEELFQMGTLDDYFLLIDEIDSIQNDSSFRIRLEDCLDIYFLFNSNNRAVLTATPIDFSSREMQQEPKTIFNLKRSKNTNIEFIQTKGQVISQLKILGLLILEKYYQKNGTVVIVLNSIKDIEKVIGTLKNYGVPESDISVLCSRTQQARLHKYYSEMHSAEYPNLICFITSAYFTGYDIQKSHHLIIFTSCFTQSTLLSVNQIKQIIGRLRNQDHLSLSLIRREAKENDKIQPDVIKLRTLTIDQFIQSAEALMKSMNCISHNMRNYNDDLDFLKTFQNGALSALRSKKFSIIRQKLTVENNKISKNEYVISNFFIDSKKEQIRVFREFYDNNTTENFKIAMRSNNFRLNNSNISGELDINQTPERLDQIANAKFLNDLMKVKTLDEYNFYVWLKQYSQKMITTEIKMIIPFMLGLLKYYPVIDLVEIVTRKMYDFKNDRMKDMRSVKNMIFAENFRINNTDFTPRIMINHYFTINQSYTRKQIMENLQLVFIKSGIEFDDKLKSLKSIMTFANLLIDFKRTRVKNEEKFKLIKLPEVVNQRPDSIFRNITQKELEGKKIISKTDLLQFKMESNSSLSYQFDFESNQPQSLNNANAVDFEDLIKGTSINLKK